MFAEVEYPGGAGVERVGNRKVHSLIWHSRQTELADLPPAEVVVLFGGGRYPDGRGAWHRVGPGSRNLYEGPGRLLVDEVAELLDAGVQPE